MCGRATAAAQILDGYDADENHWLEVGNRWLLGSTASELVTRPLRLKLLISVRGVTAHIPAECENGL